MPACHWLYDAIQARHETTSASAREPISETPRWACQQWAPSLISLWRFLQRAGVVKPDYQLVTLSLTSRTNVKRSGVVPARISSRDRLLRQRRRRSRLQTTQEAERHFGVVGHLARPHSPDAAARQRQCLIHLRLTSCILEPPSACPERLLLDEAMLSVARRLTECASWLWARRATRTWLPVLAGTDLVCSGDIHELQWCP